MPRNLLVEAGFVSLPLNTFGNCIPDIKDCVGKALSTEKFGYSRIRSWVNANRIGILIEGLSDTQSDSIKEIRGPKASVAYDLNNLPTSAAIGFASAQGLEIGDLVIREVEGEKFLFARKKTHGLSLEKCLSKLIETIFASIPFRTLPWSENSFFPQPMINFCAKLDEQTLDVELEGLKAAGEIAYFDGLKRKTLEVDNAVSYPQIMKQLNLMAEIQEKKKIYDAKVNAVLPEGHLVRKAPEKILGASIFFENSNPILVKFDKKYLEMPEVVLVKVIEDYCGYLVCEDARGRILPAAVALPVTCRVANNESAIRSVALNAEFEKLYKIWNRDIHSLPGRLEAIADQIVEDGMVRKELFSDCSLMGISEGLIDFLDKPELKKIVFPTITLIEEGDETEIGKILPGSGFSVIFNRLSGVDLFKPYTACLGEICSFFENKISCPETEEAIIICLAILLQGHVNHVKCFDCSPERILTFLRSAGLRLDLFGCFQKLFPNFKLDRKLWIDCSLRLCPRENIELNLIEDLANFSEFDPFSFFEAQIEWKNFNQDDMEKFWGLITRLKTKLSGLGRVLNEAPEEGLEAEISSRLTELEKGAGVNYLAIYNFYKNEKVDIEACLMNLPAVLDDTNPELASRISLLQRLNRQFSRLPFVKKEKRNDKI